MANDKKFIVKNGLQTDGDVFIGTSTDDSVSKLIVDGPSKFSGSFPSYPTVTIINTSGTVGSPIVEFEGSTGALSVQNIDTGDFGIFNSTNGIEFHSGNDGLIFKQGGAERLKIENGNTSFTGLATTNIEGNRIITTLDEARNGGNFDAATLDQLDSTQFVRSDQDDTMDGSYIVTGNLTVFGTTTTIDSEIVTIADNILQLNSNVTGAPSENSGIEVVRGTSDNVQLIWNEASDWWSVGNYPFESDEIRSTNGSDLTLRAPSSGAANVDITGGSTDAFVGLRSVYTGTNGYGQVLYNNDPQLTAILNGIEVVNDLNVKGDITVGNGTGGAQIFFDGAGNNGTIYSSSGEIGFLKQNFNYGAKLDVNENWVVSGNNIVEGNVISENDITAYDNIIANNNINATNGNITADAGNIAATAGNVTAGDSITAENNITATTGNVSATAGNVTAGQDVDATRDLIAGRDLSVGRDANITEDLTANNATITNNLIANTATIEDLTANTISAGDITANNITALNDIRSGRFVDNDDDTYFFDGDKTTVANTIGIDTYLFHNGDEDTKIGFPGANQIEVYAGSASPVIDITNTKTDFIHDVHAPIFYDRDDTGYFVDPAGSSIMSNIFIDDFIYHAQSINDYMGFNDANDWRVTIDNTLRLNVTDTENVSFSQFRAPIYYGSSGTTYFLDIDNTGNSISLALGGRVQVGNVTDTDRMNDTSGSGGVTINESGGIQISQSGIAGTEPNKPTLGLNRTDLGFNPFGASNRFITFRSSGSNPQHIAGDNAGNLNFIPDQDTTAIKFWSSGADNVFTINHSGDVVVAGETASYSSSDATATVGSINANKLHVQGSIQLNRDDDALVLGRGTSSFLKNNELKFGQGGGFYMDTAATVKIHDGKDLLTTGDMYAGRFYDDDDNAYYVDPAEDSQLNTVDIDDYIRHRGDVNTYFGFEADDTFRVWTNGIQRLNIDNDSADFRNNVYAPRYYDSANTDYYGDFADVSVMKTIRLDDYIRHNGNVNTYFGFFADDTIRFYTNGNQRFNLDNDSADFGVNVYAPAYYDSDNVNFFLDPASRSELNAANFSFNTATGLATNGFNVANTTIGTIHVTNGAGANNANGRQAAITFMGDLETDAAAGIYVHNNNTTGTAMAFATTDDYTIGPQIGLRITNDGRVLTSRAYFQAANSARAPIFYDSDNTNFFVDPTSESRLRTINLDDGVVLKSTDGEFGSFSISGADKNGWEGFSINDRMVFMHDNVDRVGVFNDVDNHWIWYADRLGSMRLMYNNVEQARTEDGYFLAPVQMRSPRFVDSNNVNFYGDFASTSIMNVVRANQFQVDGSTYLIDSPTGDYGSIRVEGAVDGTWAGYAIRDDWVFMADGPSTSGIYNDTNNEWAFLARRNAEVELYWNGTVQAETGNGFFDILETARAKIYRDRDNTAFYLDPAAGNTNTALNINGRISRTGFDTGSNGDNNKFLVGQDYSHWIWNTATNWGIFWAGNNGAAYSHFSTTNPNEIVFVGSGNVRASIDLDNGNAHFNGTVSAPDFALNGGNENLTLSPAYGTGMADPVLFDMTQYIDKRVTRPLTGVETYNAVTGDYSRATDGPFAGGYVIRTNGYRFFDSDYIPVEPGEEIYGEISVRLISGSGGLLYMGVRRYDKDKRPIASNDGITYFVVSGANYTGTGWQTYRGYHTLPTSHTAFNGSDGGGVKYVRLIVLMNYNAGGALREFAGIQLKRSNYHGRLRGDDIVVEGDISATGNIDAGRFRDINDTGFFTEPGNSSILRAVSIRDSGLRMERRYNNNAIWWNGGTDANHVLWNQYYGGPNARGAAGSGGFDGMLWNTYQGLRIRGGSQGAYNIARFSTDGGGNTNSHYVQLYANNVEQLGTRAGYGIAPVQMRSPIYYDSNDTGYYVDPNSTSRMIHLRLSNNDSYLKLGANAATQTTRDTNRPQIEIGNNHLYPHFTLSSWGTNSTHGGVISFRSRLTTTDSTFRRWNIGTANYQANSIQIGYFDNQENPHYGVGLNGWTYDSFSRFIIYTTYSEARGDMRAPLFRDVGNTGFYGDFASTSRMNAIQVDATTHVSGGIATFQTAAGNNRGFIQATDTDDAHFIIATSGGEDISFRDGGVSGQWNMIVRGDGNVLVNNYLYATRFYDRNSTSWYVDPASTSVLNALNVNIVHMRDRGDWITFYGDDSTNHAVSSRDNAGNTSDDIRWNTYGSFFINLDSNNNNTSAADFRIGRHGGSTGSIGNLGLFDVYGDALYVYSGFSFRAPIFYDSNNTGYYFDGASTSRANTMLTNRLYPCYDNNTGIYIDYPTGNYGSIQVNGGGRGGWEGYSINGRYVFMSADNNQMGLYNDIDNEWMLYGERNSHLYLYWNGRWEARTDNGYFRMERQARAPIYYDLNNTGYYVDPASTSNLNVTNVQSTLTVNGIHYFDNPQDYDSASITDLRNAPLSSRNRDINVGRSNAFLPFWHQTALYTDGYRTHMNVGLFKRGSGGWGDNSTGFYVALGGNDSYPTREWRLTYGTLLYNSVGYVSVNGSIRAPIFYDSNNTGYYVDPSTNGMSANLNGDIRADDIYARNWFRNDNSGEGLYNQNTGQHWYSDNDDYWNIAGGSSANGIRFRDEYAGTVRGYVYADNSNRIGFLNQSGSWRLRLVSGDWTEVLGSSIRANIFYDRNNTAYYFNGASTNSTRFLGVSNLTMAYMALSGQTRSSAQYYMARPRITGDSNYWTGAMGWGRIDMNTVANWGSGFLDSWSNPPNQPSGTSHWVGVQSYHYSRGSARYGWQLVGGPIPNLRFRNTWSTFSSWKTVAILDTNNGNGGSMYAGRYYDSNSTSYYTDPASTSQMNTITVDRINMRDRGDYITFYGDDSAQHSITSRNGNGDISDILRINSYNSLMINLDSNDNNSTVGIYLGQHGSAQGAMSGWYFQAMTDGNTYASSSFRAPIFYDRNNTGYYSNQASTSRYNQIQANTYYSPYAGGDSNLARSSYPYGWGFQEDGSWSNPYPDLVLQYHTGITMAANPNYQGIRFENDYNSGTLRFNINGGSSYTYKYTWMYTNSTGYYSDTNGWHIEPNGQTNYGSMNIRGSRGGYYGIGFYQADRDPHLMFNNRGLGAGGLYWEDSGRWAIYWYESAVCLGVASSTTSSTYELYVSGDIYATGNVVAYSDRRRKRNIETIDNALEKVLQLRGVSYNKVATPNDELKKEEIAAYMSDDGELLRKTEIGVIAQEVEEVLPEVVTYASDVDEYSVNYGNLAGLFIEAIKDQQNIINSQQQEIDELKSMVQTLMEKL